MLEVCESCELLPECQQDPTSDNCTIEIAECQWTYVQMLPGGCVPPTPEAPSCDSVECADRFAECLVQEGDRESCLGAHAACLAVIEHVPFASCEGLTGSAADICDYCESQPECDDVGDEAGLNDCVEAVASCEWERLQLMPGGCTPPEGEPLDEDPENPVASCQPIECEDAFYACRDAGNDYHSCGRALAECYVDNDHLPVSCDSFSGDPQALCNYCETDGASDACDGSSDGLDYIACMKGIATCQWDRLGVLPAECPVPTP